MVIIFALSSGSRGMLINDFGSSSQSHPLSRKQARRRSDTLRIHRIVIPLITLSSVRFILIIS